MQELSLIDSGIETLSDCKNVLKTVLRADVVSVEELKSTINLVMNYCDLAKNELESYISIVRGGK